jgi:hypothetical protein
LELTRSKDTFEATRDEKSPSEWKLKGPDINTRADAFQVQRILSDLARMEVVKWVKVKPTKGDLKDFGLAEPSLAAKVTALKEPRSKKTETWVYTFGKTTKYEDGKKTGVYGQVTGTDVIFLIDSSLTATLRDTELRDRTVFPYRIANVTEIRIEGQDDPVKRNFPLTLHLKGEKNQWKIAPKGAPQGFQFDEQKVPFFLNLLANLRLERFVKGEDKNAGLAENDRTLFIEIHVKGEKKPYQLIIGKPKKDGAQSYYYAQSSSSPKDVFLIPQQDLSQLLGTPPWLTYFKKKAE